MRSTCALVLIVSLALPTPLLAQQTGKPSIDDLYVDFAIPDVAALGLFGIDPSKVTRPGNLKEFSLALLPLSGGDANIGTGVAVSWAPVYTFAKSVDAYSTGVARRLAFSLATTKDGKSTAVTVAAGARLVLLDRSDPLLDKAFNDSVQEILLASLKTNEARDTFWNAPALLATITDVLSRMTPDTTKQAGLLTALQDPWNIVSPPARLDEAVQFARFQQAITTSADATNGIVDVNLAAVPALKLAVERLAKQYVDTVNTSKLSPATRKAQLTTLRTKYLQGHWNAPVVVVDAGELLTSSSGTWGDLRRQKLGTSISAAVAAGQSGQFVMQAQYRHGFGENPDEQWFYSGGGRLLLGNATKRFSVEALVSKARDVDPKKDGATKRVTLGTEFRISEGFWLELATGSEWSPDKSAPGASLLSLASVRYAFKTGARYTQIPGADDSN